IYFAKLNLKNFFKKPLKKKKIIFASINIFILSLILIVLNYAGIFHNLHLKISDSFHGKDRVSPNIVIIAMDKDSISDEMLGLSNAWPYKYFIDILNKVSSAKVIGFDYVFRKNDKDEQLFAKAIKDNKVILAQMSKNKNSTYFKELFFISDKGFETKSLDIYSSSAEIGEIKTLTNDDVLRNFNIGSYDGINIIENFAVIISRKFLNINTNDYFYDKIEQKYYLNQDKSKYINVVDGQFKIKFFNKPYSYKYYSFVDVLNGKIPESAFKNKIVLIGPTAPAFQDLRMVPTSDAIPMPGVEIHANAIQTIIDQDFLSDQSDFGQGLTLFIVTLISCFACLYLGIFSSIVYVFLAGIIYFFTAKISFNHGIIMNMVYPYIAIVLSFISVYLYRYFTEIKSKKELQLAFGKYVNPEIVKKITENPEMVALGGEEKEITVFFSDIENFTNVSERFKPKDLIILINEYCEVMVNIILQNHGTLDKFEGDAIMAFWGAPLDLPDHAYYACKTAIEARNALIALHEKWTRENKPLLNFRCGINTGTALIGNMGAKVRMEYTAIGDNVNLASRLEGINKQYGTHSCISEMTYEKVKDKFEVRRLDKIRVKGKNIAVTIYELLAEKGHLTEEALPVIQNFEKGFDSYQQKNFTQAKEYFNQVLQVRPNDEPSKIYLERCDHFISNPPAINWDGVWVWGVK
ncbi:hypothetical protein A2307_04255, partial [Candidatus Peregrinibacteria bacterium RIFOXYB2_FULL_33_20]